MRGWKSWRPGDLPGGRHPRARAALVPAALALALTLVAAACGASGGGEEVASAGGSKTAAKDEKEKDPQQAGLDWAKCMREHGVDVPDPQGDDGFIRVGPGPAEGGPTAGEEMTPPAGFEEADKACRHYLDDLIQDGGGPVDPKEQDRALRFAKCMREHGVDIPDPEFNGGGGVSITIGEGFDPGSQTVKEAHAACQKYMGPAGGQPGVAARGGKTS